MDIAGLPQITSRDNRYLKEFRLLQQKKYRKKLGLFTAEGLRLVEEALTSSFEPAYALITPEILQQERGTRLAEELNKRCQVFLLESEGLLKRVSDTENPQGVALALKIPPAAPEEWRRHLQTLVLIADGISDPGNLGALFRTALAAGADALITMAGSADCYHPKVVRATMGALFQLPFYEAESEEEVLALLHQRGFNLFAAHGRGSRPYTEADFRPPFALVMGSEAQGIGSFWQKEAHALLHLPMSRGVESLNVAVAAGVFLYEARRQRGL